MEPHLSTTPFGRRTLTLAHVANQAIAKTRAPEKAVHKWQVFHAVCAAKTRIGVSERALAVLNALLSFHPETALTGEGLIVFPSNAAALAARPWHGADDAPSPARRSRRQRPDRPARQPQRQALRAQRAGKARSRWRLASIFRPLVVRAEQFEAWAEEVRAEERALKLVRERITHLPARHRQDDRHRHRGRRANPPRRTGARRLDGAPRPLSRHP